MSIKDTLKRFGGPAGLATTLDVNLARDAVIKAAAANQTAVLAAIAAVAAQITTLQSAVTQLGTQLSTVAVQQTAANAATAAGIAAILQALAPFINAPVRLSMDFDHIETTPQPVPDRPGP